MARAKENGWRGPKKTDGAGQRKQMAWAKEKGWRGPKKTGGVLFRFIMGIDRLFNFFYF